MHKGQRRLTCKTGPNFFLEDANDLVAMRQRVKQSLDKAQSKAAVLVNELERGYIYRINAHLTVAYDPVTGELKTCNAVVDDAHVSS